MMIFPVALTPQTHALARMACSRGRDLTTRSACLLTTMQVEERE
jgi:hypothetical protein